MAGLKAPMDAIWDEDSEDSVISACRSLDIRKGFSSRAQVPSSETGNQKRWGRSTGSGNSINMLDTPAKSKAKSKSKSKEPEAGGGASMDKGPFCVPCDQCSKEHPPYSYCPYMPCHVCYKDHHPTYCPYLFSIPRGAPFNPGYEIICQCGNVFNEDKWVCTFCGRDQAMLISKYCDICNSSNQHGAYECPEDKVVAARNKLARDKIKSIVPYRIAYVPKSSSYVPTPPPGFVNI